jgi:site-specific DNA recombinase
MKRFVALARVSSREQEREGFSLAVQEDALRRYATNVGGEVARLFRIAETASKSDERKTFRELIAYAKKHSEELDGLLFYKVDRAARNLFDYVELERLESEYGLAFISVSQPTESNPAGRMMRRTLANMASFYTEQQSLDVREGLARRVQEGWFVGKAPYGYRNVRRDGRCVTETDAAAAANVRRLFHLYAYEPLTLDALRDRLQQEGLTYRPDSPRFTRSKLHGMLSDPCVHRRDSVQGGVVSGQARAAGGSCHLGPSPGVARRTRLPRPPDDLCRRVHDLRPLWASRHW